MRIPMRTNCILITFSCHATETLKVKCNWTFTRKPVHNELNTKLLTAFELFSLFADSKFLGLAIRDDPINQNHIWRYVYWQGMGRRKENEGVKNNRKVNDTIFPFGRKIVGNSFNKVRKLFTFEWRQRHVFDGFHENGKRWFRVLFQF